MGLRIVLHRRVEQDLQDIRNYLLRAATPRAAENVRAHLQRRIQSLARLPHMGRPTSDPEVRILPPTRYQYRIYYTVSVDAVIMLHIRHTARRAPNPGELL
ncbi:MAG: type II toxin-antitoxin system RelE/ParE family toxin [Hyphomicrobiaceae bacterium]